MRIVSLVPSVTETLHQLGVGDRLVGVTGYCVHGAPESARRIGGTKNPVLDEIVALGPDLVLANTEENRPPDLDALRAHGLAVREDFPRTVAEVPALIRGLGAATGADADRTKALAADVEAALAEVAANRPPRPVPVLVPIWRKPWMGVGPGTYVDDLLAVCGFANVLADRDERYPRLGGTLATGSVEVVLLPSEPYRFGPRDVGAVRDLVGEEPALEFVDGEQLTWHGPRTASALREFAGLARRFRG